jgi:lipoprotein-anchoring transpeptidase ErfK/SrfK
MYQSSARPLLLIAASALLFAFTPIRSARAEQAAAAEPVAAAPVAVPVAQPATETVAAADATAAAAAMVVARSASLRPGEFVWQPERSSEGAVEIVVSLPLQRAYVYRGGTVIGVTTVSTGRPGHATPTGRFDILEKQARHFSRKYNNAPMPFMQRLTWDGVALHAGQIPGRPASHGCVRLPLAFAKALFGVTQVGATVHIVGQSPSPEQALAMVRGGTAYASLASAN